MEIIYIKYYPYIQNPWYETKTQQQKRLNFLEKIDKFINHKIYVKLTLLNWQEKPLRAIEGEISNGTLTKDGSSAIRRSAQLTAALNAGSYDLLDIESDYSINKKVYLELGIVNYTDMYREYPIIWFPQGMFIIGSFSCNTSTSSALNISLTLRDKMSLLNGDAGGTIQSTTIFDEMDTQLPTGEEERVKVPIYSIIQEAVNHFGKEDLNNIVIEDVDLRIKKVMKWTGDNPLYLVSNGGTAEAGNLSYIAQSERPTNGAFIQINNNEDAGYTYDTFVYPDELVMNAGSTVTNVLDKIRSLLGNYEYFYDEYGVFHFREIKNFLNTTQATALFNDMTIHDYLVDTTLPKSTYVFTDDTNIISLNRTPQYENIKNDYIVQGLRKGNSNDTAYPIFYHLVIDKKPQTGNRYTNVLIYIDPKTNNQIAVMPTLINSTKDGDSKPEIGEFNTIYYNAKAGKAYYWDTDVYKELKVINYFDYTKPYITQDWRTELYMQGLLSLKNATDAPYYWEELRVGWPTIYDLNTQTFLGQQEAEELQSHTLTDGNWYLDFIDTSTPYGKYAVDAIGRRTNVTVNEDINCLFQPEIPNIVFLNLDLQDEDPEKFQKLREECQDTGQPYSQTRGEIYSAFVAGGYKNGAFDQIKYDLLTHTSYQESLSITALPCFYLEPNSRVTINDKVTQTFGDFMIGNINIPLSPGSSMTVSASQVLERYI